MAFVINVIKWLLWTVETMYFDVVEPVFLYLQHLPTQGSLLLRPRCVKTCCWCSRFSGPPFQHTGGYVETSFSLPGSTLKRVSTYHTPPGTLKLEKAQFQVTLLVSDYPRGYRGYVETGFKVPPGILKLKNPLLFDP